MPPSSISPLRFSLGRGTRAVPREQQRPLLPTGSVQASALARLNLKPATVALGRQTRGNYACLGTPSGRSMYGGAGGGVYSGGEESGDEDEGEALPQNACRRCCLGLCLLTVLLVAGTGLVLRFLLARDSHPSSPAAKLASLSARRAPPAPKAKPRTAMVLGVKFAPPPTPLTRPPSPSPWPPAPEAPPEPSPPPPLRLPPPPPPSPSPPSPPPSPPSPPLPLREMGALTIPAVAARVEARTKQQHRARNETRDSRIKL